MPIPAGHFVMGDSEGDANEVTNRQFDAFVARTNHLTDAD